MAITVRELARLPHLRFTLVAGEAGLDNEVSWVHTSDLPEPWKWHGSGELLMLNCVGLPAEEAEQVQFVERLAECGASGLGVGLGLSGPPLLDVALRRAGAAGADRAAEHPVHCGRARGRRRERARGVPPAVAGVPAV